MKDIRSELIDLISMARKTELSSPEDDGLSFEAIGRRIENKVSHIVALFETRPARPEVEKREAVNPHWKNEQSCRDYIIGNITLKSVPDSFVMNHSKFRGGYGFASGNVSEFLNDCRIEITFDPNIFKVVTDVEP